MIGEPETTYVVAGAIALIAGAGLAYYVARRGSFGARVGLVLGAAAIFPVLQIIPLVLTSAVVADRLLYVPLAGLALLLAAALSHRGLRVVGGAAIVLALALGASTSARAADYSRETTFWVIAAENAHPHNPSARMALARWLLDSGEPEPACKLFEHAVAMLSAEGLSARPPYRRAREGLASCWARIGRFDDALRLSRDLARELPNHARVALELGYAELHVRHFDDAAAAFARAARLENRPVAGFVVSLDRLAAIREEDAAFDTLTPHERAEHLAALGRGPEASKAFLDVALKRNVTDVTEDERYDAAAYLKMHGDYPDAVTAIERLPPPPRGWDMRVEDHWRRRVRVHESVIALAPRIDALAR
jgi:tetratricopeptide (TPR) repeat protein